MSSNYEYVKEEATRLLARLKVQPPPVNLASICEKLDIGLARSPLGSRAAVLMNSPQMNSVLIMVNSDHRLCRQRFSIAHELGHYMLNHSCMAFSGGDGFMQFPEEEREANIFAAELLMPERYLLHCWAVNKLNTYDVSLIFNVSRQAATIAINHLYFIHDELLNKHRRNYWIATYLMDINI